MYIVHIIIYYIYNNIFIIILYYHNIVQNSVSRGRSLQCASVASSSSTNRTKAKGRGLAAMEHVESVGKSWETAMEIWENPWENAWIMRKSMGKWWEKLN